MKEINTSALILLKAYRHRITNQQYNTLRGQVLSGEDAGAVKGLKRILRRGTNDR